MIKPTKELFEVLVDLDAGETANLEPALKSLVPAALIRGYMIRKQLAISARKVGRISEAIKAERECELLFESLPDEWKW